MPPSLRKRVKLNYPKCGDQISVLWTIGSEQSWWNAHVLTIDACTSNDTMATGSIVYEKSSQFEEQISDVEFFRTARNGTLLRDLTSSSSSTSFSSNTRRRQPTNSVSNEVTSTLVTKKRKATVCSWTYTRDLETSTHASQKVDISKHHLNCDNIKVEEHEISINQVITPFKAEPKLEQGSNISSHLKNGYNSSPNCLPTSSDSSFIKVITELRLSLLMQFQSKNKAGKCINSGNEYLVRKIISTEVTCTLQEFTELCCFINNHRERLFPSFIPSYQATQDASLATDFVKISFNRFKHLCKSLGLRDYRDYAELVSKDGVEQHKSYLRIVGTSSCDDLHHKRDAIYVGSNTVGYAFSESDASNNELVVLSRSRTNWSSQQGRFLSNWTLSEVMCGDEMKMLTNQKMENELVLHHEDVNMNNMNTIASSVHSEANDYSAPVTPNDISELNSKPWFQSFDMIWKRTVLPSSRIWTCDALRTKDVTFGQLQVSVPTILVTGDSAHAQILPLLCSVNYNKEFNKN